MIIYIATCGEIETQEIDSPEQETSETTATVETDGTITFAW